MEKLKTILEQKGYIVNLFNNKSDAISYLNSNIDNTTVGIGGSQTIEELNLYDILKTHNEVYSHAHLDGQNHVYIRHKENESDIYLSSVNAITKDGIIVNLDGFSNRVAAISFGMKKVYLIIGENKIVNTLDDAIYRVRNIVAPKNAKRLGIKTPCAIKGDKCYDCKSKDSICRTMQILLNMPKNDCIYEVILIKDELGY